MSTLFVGIDVSKDFSTAKGLSIEGKSKFYIELKMDSEGFSQLLAAIRSNCEDFSEATVAMESTG